MKELAKQYDPSQVEDRIYQFWLDGGYFHTKADPDKKPYTIVMPPPNVTGQLHMGHAVDNTMQDILIRTKRMQGYAALWVPGTDHASIATEAKVVEAMRAEGLTKEMVGRDGFLERAWAWKTKYGNRIVSQLKKLGCSCDWQRERFTMDEGCSDAVKEVFVRLYNEGLIYRGNRMVNWCPHCNTSISDAEVEYEAKEGSFWHLLYPVKETGEMLELATTRPETMLGDTAVAINAEDPRYKHLHGCHVVLPLLGREIPIVCDEHADMEKGTGVVKITPAHDPNDFGLGGNGRMVGAGHPQRGIALHPLVAGQDVLPGLIHGVAHVQLAGDVRRRHDDGKRLFAAVDLGMEIPLVAPVLIDAILGALRGILFGEFLRHSVNLLVNVRGVIFTFGQNKKSRPMSLSWDGLKSSSRGTTQVARSGRFAAGRQARLP